MPHPSIVSRPPDAVCPPPSRCDVSRPADFEEFWHHTLQQTDAVPLNATFERDALRCTDDVDVFDVRYDSFGGVRVAAWYCVPEAHGQRPVEGLPALILPPGYIQDPVIPRDWAALGYAAITPAPRGKLRSREQFDAGYPGLLTENITDRNTYGYRGFFMDVVRTIDLLKARPEVDSARIGINGPSQGGALALIAPALRPDDIVCSASAVPYLADYLGAIELTRTYPYQEITDYLRLYPERRSAVKETLAYFDCLNFAPQVCCPTIVSLGTRDNIVPPETCRAAFEAIASTDKTLYCYGDNGHDGGAAQGHNDAVRDFLAEHLL